MKLDIVANKNLKLELLRVDYFPKSLVNKAYIQITFKKGMLGERVKYYQEDISELTVVENNELTSDTSTRVKNTAIGAVLLGPIGLLGAALGGKVTELKIKLETKNDEILLFSLKSKYCDDLFQNLIGVNLQEYINQEHLSS